MSRLAAALAALVGVWVVAVPVQAGPEAEVASAFDPGDRYDVHVSFEYRLTSRRSAIRRELGGAPGTDPDGPLPLVRDLVFSSTRHELVPRVEVGVFTDLAVTLALPLVVRDSRRLEFDQRADDCGFAANPRDATCIDETNSTTVTDRLLPAEGFDAGDPDGGGAGGAVFRGQNRAGLDQLHLGVVWAPFNQARDPSKPTWKVGSELRFSLGEVMTYDNDDPAGESGVSRGIHELRLYTSMARQMGWAEPFFEMWWMTPLGARRGAPLDELSGGPAESGSAQRRAGSRFGVEVAAWQSRSKLRVDVQIGAELEALFAGRAYSDMWEVFAYAGQASTTGPLLLDRDPAAPGLQAASHPGVSSVDGYVTAAGRLGVDAVVTDKIRAVAGFRLGWDQPHLISAAEPGQDRGDDANDVIDPLSEEVNPLHAPVIDSPGHRYRVEDTLTYAVSLGVRVLF